MTESLSDSTDSRRTKRLARRPPAASASDSAEIARWVRQFAQRWQAGERLVVEDMLKIYPELVNKPDAVMHLVCEEICLRQEYGEPLDESELFQRFPKWKDEIRVLLECHQLFERDPGLQLSVFPELGQILGEFYVVAELGRGAQSRVFLATQQPLADRHVVLKVVNPASVEHRSLARLQHTNIVPLYSIHAEPTGKWLLLCMPYFGNKTLADIFHRLRHIPADNRIGADILRALDANTDHLPELPRRGHARTFLSRLSYASAVCWVGACLAEAIEYAHERDLLHLDIKPSNVLVTVEAIPMLLDFHLAQPPLEPSGSVGHSLASVPDSGSNEPSHLGGTYAYMSPEQRQAIEDIREGRPLSVSVGPRSDVYSLGVVLCEAFGAEVSESKPCEVPRENPILSKGLADVLAKCLAPDQANRYPSAAALAEDLRRHLNDQLLRGVPNRSWKERWNKWNRRNPYVLSRALVGSLALGFVALTIFLLSDLFRKQNSQGFRTVSHPKHEVDPPGWAAYTRGKSLLERGMLAGAKEDLGLAIEQNPESPEFQFLYGVCCYRMREAKAAIYAFGAALSHAEGKQKAKCYANRGMAYALAGNEKAALRDYQAALKLDPKLGAVYLNRGALRYSREKHAEALADFRKARELGVDPEQVLYNLSLVHKSRQEYELAIECLENLLQINPGHTRAADLLRRLKQIDEKQ